MKNSPDPVPNHLMGEKSPYLIQHVYNPVDWHPWGDAAIGKAIRENKPILLSIGYATCHWCHVMEKESFENQDIAGIMNRHFVCIKVDREERPDIDSIYMSAATAINGSGGWPLNVFLTPDLKPFFAGTYFPAETKELMISWPDLLQRIAGIWNTPGEREKLVAAGKKIAESIKNTLAPANPHSQADALLDSDPISGGMQYYVRQFDKAYGGFSPAPKFPSPVILNFLMARCEAADSKKNETIEKDRALMMAKKTLSAMADGGIYDQLGGGFHRYSTDRMWHIPHFEKMLYDNAQLIINYIDMHRITGEACFRETARATTDYVLRDLRHVGGGFFSGEDADSPEPCAIDSTKRKEGAFYAWEYEQVRTVLDKPDFEIVAYHFGIRPQGNVQNDPHTEFVGKNILFISRSLKETADRFQSDERSIQQIVGNAVTKLLSVRNQRIRPRLDDKVLTAWNGLMISALAKVFGATGEKTYQDAAGRAAAFIEKNLYDADTKTLYRRWRDGERKVSGMAEDYAFLIQGLIDLYEADFQSKWLDFALALAETQILRFYDKDRGGFFMTEEKHDRHLIVRIKDEHDSVLPGANSISAINFLRLARYFKRDDLDQTARRTIGFFFPKISRFPGAMPQMLVALHRVLSKPNKIG